MTSVAKAKLCVALVALPWLVGFVQCTKAPVAALSVPAERGRITFATFCFPCHNPSNPHRNGQLGPAVARSSKELLEAKVLSGTYPPGYQPKQAGAQMAALPHVKAHLGDIEAFLAEVPEPKD